MRRWDPRAVIVLILALAVSVGHVFAVVMAAYQGRSLGQVGGDVLTAILGAIIAIIAAYVSSSSQGGGSDDDRGGKVGQVEEPPSGPGSAGVARLRSSETGGGAGAEEPREEP